MPLRGSWLGQESVFGVDREQQFSEGELKKNGNLPSILKTSTFSKYIWGKYY